LLVVGGGLSRYEEELKRELKRAQLEEAIVLAGVVPQLALFKLLKACQIFISPSYEEGWGIALLEALASGLPAVAYDLPAYKPFGLAVRRVKVGDWRALAVELVKLLQDPASYQKQVSLGQTIVQDYDWKKLAEGELHLLRNLGKND
jgi:glycosyltransferase involved in cell wall biosynthesis